MSQFQTFYINGTSNIGQCDDLNRFLRSHEIIDTVKQVIIQDNLCGILFSIEYKDPQPFNMTDKKHAKIDWRETLSTDEQKALFDELKKYRKKLAKDNNIKANYLICKDEHIAAIVKKPDITLAEISKLPNSGNILLKEFAGQIFNEYQRLRKETCFATSLAPLNTEPQSALEDDQSKLPF